MHITNRLEVNDMIGMSPYLTTLKEKLRAHDAYGVWNKVEDEVLLTRFFILTKEQRKKIDVMKSISPETIGKIRMVYEAVAQMVEKELGEIVITVVDINTEGFGRVLLVSEDKVLIHRIHRNVHKYGFKNFDDLITYGEGLVKIILS